MTSTISGNPGRSAYGGQPLVPHGAAFIIESVGCSYRQLDRWASDGLFGEEIRRVGSGGRREWTWRHAEIAWAIASLQRLGAGMRAWRAAADALGARPVNPNGEVLVVDVSSNAHRFDHWCGVADELATPVCVIPLRSFVAIPAGSDEGVAVTAAAAPTPSP